MSKKYLPDLNYIPDNLTEITPKTLLNKGVSLGVFLPNTDINHITSLEERKQICRNLLPQAHILKYMRNHGLNFSNYRINVVEGLYKKYESQQITNNSILDLQTKGRVVVYELKYDGKPNIDKTVELANNISIFQKHYDKVILDYDNYSKSGELNVQIIITMPQIPSDYNVRFKREYETLYNNVSYGDDLIKLKM
jgi:hypothetical protein